MRLISSSITEDASFHRLGIVSCQGLKTCALLMTNTPHGLYGEMSEQSQPASGHHVGDTRGFQLVSDQLWAKGQLKRPFCPIPGEHAPPDQSCHRCLQPC